jgi:hypothetical protein
MALLAIGAGASFLTQRFFDRRTRLITYYGHTSIHRVAGAVGTPAGTIHTHSVVVRNVGRATAHNVRLSHAIDPINIDVQPPTSYRREQVANSGDDLVFERLVPGQQVTISYVYLPPTVFTNFGTWVRSDEGMARGVNVIPQQQVGPQILAVLWLLITIGFVTTTYFALQAINWATTTLF